MTYVRLFRSTAPCALVALLMLGCDRTRPVAEEKGPPLTISLTVEAKKQADGNIVLVLHLTNTSEKPLVIYEAGLPWMGAYGLTLIVLETDIAEGRPLKPDGAPLSAPQIGHRTIQPNETVSGEIKLSLRYPELATALKQADVEVFWSYKMRPVDKTDVRRVGGWLLLEKSPD